MREGTSFYFSLNTRNLFVSWDNSSSYVLDSDDVTGDIAKRLCTAAEVKFFLDSLLGKSVSANYLKPNKNCNLTSWVSGCEPGWACSDLSSQKVDLKNSKEIPARTSNCQPCCEGFFCPHGITCMIRKYTDWESLICIFTKMTANSFFSNF